MDSISKQPYSFTLAKPDSGSPIDVAGFVNLVGNSEATNHDSLAEVINHNVMFDWPETHDMTTNYKEYVRLCLLAGEWFDKAINQSVDKSYKKCLEDFGGKSTVMSETFIDFGKPYLTCNAYTSIGDMAWHYMTTWMNDKSVHPVLLRRYLTAGLPILNTMLDTSVKLSYLSGMSKDKRDEMIKFATSRMSFLFGQNVLHAMFIYDLAVRLGKPEIVKEYIDMWPRQIDLCKQVLEFDTDKQLQRVENYKQLWNSVAAYTFAARSNSVSNLYLSLVNDYHSQAAPNVKADKEKIRDESLGAFGWAFVYTHYLVNVHPHTLDKAIESTTSYLVDVAFSNFKEAYKNA